MQKTCPLCGRTHEVDAQGMVPTWVVAWTGRAFLEKPCGRPSRLSPQRQARLETLRRKYPERTTHTSPQMLQMGMIVGGEVRFLHYPDALAEYHWIERILRERGDYEEQQQYLVIKDGERLSWYDLFESPDAYWEA